MKMTVAQIAKMAGVSASTVSRVINGNCSVAEEKRLAVIEVLNKVDIPLRKTPKRRGEQTKMIGVFIMDGFFGDPESVLRKLQQMVLKLPGEYSFRLLSTQLSSELVKSWYRKGEISALALLGHGHNNPKLVSAIKAIPHVWLNSHALAGETPSILSGNEASGRMAAKYLIEHECSNILMLTLPSCNPGYEARLEGFRFECFTSNKKYSEISGVLPEGKKTFEECNNQQVEAAIAKCLTKREADKLDGLFVPESKVMALVHRSLTRHRVRRFPLMISCNNAKSCFAGLYPRPAYIDFDADMVAQLAIEQLRQILCGGTELSGRVSIIVNPFIVPGDNALTL